MNKTIDKIVSLCKRRGIIFQSSEIYGGFSAVYDYGPLGVELKNNISKFWWKEMTQIHENIVGLDSGILMHPSIWEASGHVGAFNDPLVDCKSAKQDTEQMNFLMISALLIGMKYNAQTAEQLEI